PPSKFSTLSLHDALPVSGFLMLRRSKLHQYFHVADVRRLAVKKVMAERRAPQRLADAREFGKGETLTAIFFRQMRRPETQRPDLDRKSTRLNSSHEWISY